VVVVLRSRPWPVLAAAVLVAVSTAACSSSDDARGCTPARLKTKQAGVLTLSTGLITRAPWVVGGGSAAKANDPHLGKGYDAAVGYALAHELGYDRDHVVWVGSPFPASVAPGTKPFDVSINQATISADRRKAVDLTSPYWVVRDAVVTLKGRALAGVDSLSALRKVQLAAVAGTPADGLDLVRYDDLDGMRGAVSSGHQQGLVTDYNTALKLADDDRQLVDGEMVALLPAAKGADGYGFVLQKGSPLTSCVDDALSALRHDGTLDRLEREWLVQEPGLRDLR
jgi:polar amino acid transport system substrate-binding protein